MSLTPIELEVLWNRLLSVANEQQTALIRRHVDHHLARARTAMC